MAEQVLNTFKADPRKAPVFSLIVLAPSAGGVFDVKLDGEIVFSKHAVGRHAEPNEVVELLRKKLPGS